MHVNAWWPGVLLTRWTYVQISFFSLNTKGGFLPSTSIVWAQIVCLRLRTQAHFSDSTVSLPKQRRHDITAHGKTTCSRICVASVETAAHTGINSVLMIYLFIFGSQKRQTLLWCSCTQKFSLLSSQFLTLICSNHCRTFGLTWVSPSCSSLNYINTNPRVGLASRISVSKWSHLSSTAIVSFFSLVQVKKRQLLPLSPHHLLVSCGAEKCDDQHIGIKQDNKTVTPLFITGQLFKAGFTHTRGEA